MQAIAGQTLPWRTKGFGGRQYILAVLNGRRSWNISLWHSYFTVVICMGWSVVRTHGAEYRQLHTSTGNKLGTDGGKAIGKAFEVNTSRQVCAKAS